MQEISSSCDELKVEAYWELMPPRNKQNIKRYIMKVDYTIIIVKTILNMIWMHWNITNDNQSKKEKKKDNWTDHFKSFKLSSLLHTNLKILF